MECWLGLSSLYMKTHEPTKGILVVNSNTLYTLRLYRYTLEVFFFMPHQLMFQTAYFTLELLLFQIKDARSVLGPTVFLSGNRCQSGYWAQLCRGVCAPLCSGVTPGAASSLTHWTRADQDPNLNHQPSRHSAGISLLPSSLVPYISCTRLFSAQWVLKNLL